MASAVTADRSEDDVPIPWSEIQAEWRDREYNVARRAISALDGVAVDDVVDLLFASGSLVQENADDILHEAFAAAAQARDGTLLLALYLYGRCLEKWEQSEDYARIHVVLRALEKVARTARQDGSPVDARAQLFSGVVGQAQVMKGAMAVEDALSCSCPVATGERARDIVASLDALLGQELARDDDLNGVREVIQADAETGRHYFQTIAAVADAVLAYVVREAPGPTDRFDDVLTELGVALEGDVYESELRAHRATLTALRDRADEPCLQIDDAELIYVYPFALAGIDAKAAVERTLGNEVVEALGALGLGSLEAHTLELNDIWEPRDAREPGYSGVSIELPSITVTTTAPDQFVVDAEARLSSLGNHHLRVRCRLRDAGLHEVNQALRRGTHAMGEERLTSENGKWTKFRHYADDVVGTIATSLNATRVDNLDATSHVVLAARSISVQQRDGSDGSTTPATLAEVREAVGASLLFHPVRHLATSLEEWIRYPQPTVENLLGQHGYAGDLVARTDNTTVTFMPASPEWLIDEYGEMIEFVASVPPLLTHWEEQAWSLAKQLDLMLERTNSIDSLHQQEIERRLTQLAERQERIAAFLRREQQETAERFADRVQAVLGFLAAASLTGVALWINDAFDVNNTVWAWGETAGLIIASLVIVVVIVLARRSR